MLDLAITIDLPKAFYDDHVSRGLPAGRVEKVLAKKYRIRVSMDELLEILSDARHYAEPGQYGWEYQGLTASARATRDAIEKEIL